MNFKKIYDYNLIKNTIKDRHVFPYIKDDSTPFDYEPMEPIDGYLIYLGVFDGDDYLGIFQFIRKNGVTFEAHICLLPSSYGKARDAGRQAIDWIFSNESCERIIAEVPSSNVQAIKMAQDIGFRFFGKNEKSIRKNGNLIDIYCYGISRG